MASRQLLAVPPGILRQEQLLLAIQRFLADDLLLLLLVQNLRWDHSGFLVVEADIVGHGGHDVLNLIHACASGIDVWTEECQLNVVVESISLSLGLSLFQVQYSLI